MWPEERPTISYRIRKILLFFTILNSLSPVETAKAPTQHKPTPHNHPRGDFLKLIFKISHPVILNSGQQIFRKVKNFAKIRIHYMFLLKFRLVFIFPDEFLDPNRRPALVQTAQFCTFSNKRFFTLPLCQLPIPKVLIIMVHVNLLPPSLRSGGVGCHLNRKNGFLNYSAWKNI